MNPQLTENQVLALLQLVTAEWCQVNERLAYPDPCEEHWKAKLRSLEALQAALEASLAPVPV